MDSTYTRLEQETDSGIKRLDKHFTLAPPVSVFVLSYVAGEGGDTPNNLRPIKLYCKLKETTEGQVVPVCFTVYRNGVILLDHHNYITHSMRKWLNFCLPKELRVIMRGQKFFILDEQGVKHPFDNKVIIVQGKVQPV